MRNLTTTKLTKAEIKKIIISEVPRLIKTDPKVRDFIVNISSERFASKKETDDRFERLLEELKKDREENQRKWEENQKQWEESNKKWQENQRHLERLERQWAEKWEENERKWQENLKVINSMLEEIKLLHRKYDTRIGAIGARWGFRAESAFRGSMKEILEEMLPLRVERYRGMDEEGIVFGRPDQVELDLIIRDGIVVVAEIKSSISKGDVATFIRKVQFYERKEGREVSKRIIISPMVDSAAMEYASANGIKVYGYPEEVEISELQR